MWFEQRASMPMRPRRQSVHHRALMVGWLMLCIPLLGHTTQADLPMVCDVNTTNTQPSADDENCVEFGAAVGELGLSWRQKLPDNVRWITRKDASTLCAQTQTEWGQKVGQTSSAESCVFLTPKVCTIVTSGYVSHAVLGNAVRDCAP